MNVMFVSQCSGRALVQTRRILDQFAERRGERSWHTPITLEGLNTVQKLLRKTARKNSSVACYRIRRNGTELVWIVGTADRFNRHGATPTNTTERDVLRHKDEDDWRHGEIIRLLASMAALFHDFGKANTAFQQKLKKSGRPKADAYRHEWVSLRLFAAFVGDASDDLSWLRRLADVSCDLSDWRHRLQRDDNLANSVVSTLTPLRYLPPTAQAIGWLIVTHHRLPCPDSKEAVKSLRDVDFNSIHSHISAEWFSPNLEARTKDRAACWEFKHGIPFDSNDWRMRASKLATEFLRQEARLDNYWFKKPQVMHIARLALILADHYYSSIESVPLYGEPNYPLFANTGNEGDLKQRLDEHLIGVELHASQIVRTLPRLYDKLPRIARHRGFRRRTESASFRWQNRAFDLAENLRQKANQHGFFGINIASTGTGKTLASGRIMYALADPQLGARFTLALGLRTLTLQTGDVYRERLHLKSDHLAVLVGGGGLRELHSNEEPRRFTGSESAEDLLPDNSYVDFEESLGRGPLKAWLSNQSYKQLVDAPVVACTIDHLIPATEGVRGGKQILPMLRLLTSDLVLDEVDDFGVNDLYAVSRLVHWAGMLGCKVLLSSATLPPALVKGLFQGYLAGRKAFQQSRGDPNQSLNVVCAWFDEFNCRASECEILEDFSAAHTRFVEHRIQNLHKEPLRRHVRMISVKKDDTPSVYESVTDSLFTSMHQMHRENCMTDPKTGKTLSIGLIRLANINPLVEVARRLIIRPPERDFELHFNVYHSQFPLLVRHKLESQLDRLLHREDQRRLFDDRQIRKLLDERQFGKDNVVLVVLASPVAEVGRDHDYDWAIVEPSSMRAIIQLAGRVRRHRHENWNERNIGLLESNIRAMQGKVIAYSRPGFESEYFKLNTHLLHELLRPAERSRIDATWRIQAPIELDSKSYLSDLEHTVLADQMLGGENQTQTPTKWWWETYASMSAVLQAKHRFRASEPRTSYCLLPNKGDEENLHLHRIETHSDEPTPCEYLREELSVGQAPNCHWWGSVSDIALLEEYANEHNMAPESCARRYMTIELPDRGEQSRWHYHPALGFCRQND